MMKNTRKLFFTNVHVRKYLQSKRRVNKIMDNPAAQEKFIIFLEKQLNEKIRGLSPGQSPPTILRCVFFLTNYEGI